MTDLDVTIKFITDKRSQTEAKAAIDQVAKSTSSWAEENKRLAAQLKSEFGLEQMGGQLDTLSQKLEVLDANTKEVTKSFETFGRRSRYGMMGMVGMAMSMAGARLSAFGRSGLAPINQYTAAFGETEAASAAWLQTQERLEGVMVRIGRVMAEQLLPTFEKLTDLAQKAADFAEQHPEAVKAAGTIFGGAVIGGGILSSVGGLLAGTAGLKYLGTLGKGAIGGGGALGGILGALLSPYAGGIGVGLAGYQGLTQTQFGQEKGMASLAQYATVIAHGLGSLFGKADEWTWTIGTLTGAIKTADEATASLANSTDKMLSTAQLKAYLSYYEQDIAAQQKYLEQRQTLTKNYNEKLREYDQAYIQSRADYLRDFYQNERKIEQDYYLNRKRLAEDYSIDIQRMEQDHQIKMRKLSEEHDYRMEDLVARRDALGIVREMRDYERSRRDAEDEYRLEASRRSQDFSRKMQQMAEEFATERQYRVQQFQQNLKDMEDEYRLRRQQMRDQYRKELIDLQDKYNQERKQRRDALIRHLEDTTDGLTAERLLRQRFTAAMLADLQAAINAVYSQAKTALPPARDSGGYMQPGIYRNASGALEFALSPQTTRAAERMAHGRLTQASILQMMLGGGKGAVTYNDHRRIDGRITAEDRRAIQRDTAALLQGLIA